MDLVCPSGGVMQRVTENGPGKLQRHIGHTSPSMSAHGV